jgi:hypothetical protein
MHGAALAGLIGTLAGAAIGAAAAIVSTTLLQRREDRRERDRRALETMRALRTMESVLGTVGGMLYASAETKRWPIEGALEITFWEQHFGAIAAGVPERQDWRTIAFAFESVRHVVLFQALAGDEPSPPKDWQIEMLRDASTACSKAIDVIRVLGV